MKSIRVWHLIALLTFFQSIAHAQQPVSYTINEKDDLPSNEVYQLIQDSLGYMFIGCSSGLYRYDGFHYKPILGKNQNGKAISHLLKDNQGTIWCQNFAGQIYQVKNDSLVLLRDYSSESISFPQYTVYGSTVWILLKNRIISLGNNQEEETIPYPKQEEWNITSLVADTTGQLYFTVFGKGLYQFNTLTKEFKLLSDDNSFKERCVSGLKNNTVLVVGEQRATKKYSFHLIIENKIKSIQKSTIDLKAELVYQWKIFEEGTWLCTSNGAFLYPKNNFEHVQFHLFENEDVSSVTKDTEGNLWFTTLSGAIKVVPSIDLLSINHSGNNQQPAINATASYTSLNGQKFIGTLSGKVYSVTKNRTLAELVSNKNIIYRRVTKIIQYKNLLLIARGSLSIIDKNNKETTYPFSFIRDMYLKDSLLYIVNSTDFGVFNLSTRVYTKIKEGNFRKISIDSKNTIALTSNTGVQLFANNSFRDLLFKNRAIHASAIHYSNDTLWLGTLNDGIIGFVNRDVTFHFTSPVLKGSTISTFYSVGKFLYASTEAGLNVFNTSNQTHSFSGKRLHVDFQGVNSMSVVNDTAYFATQSGYYYFPINIINQQNPAPSIRLTSTTCDGKAFNYKETNRFSHSENNIQVTFKSISYRNRNTISYKYRLKGLSEGWINLNGASDQVYFESIQPGHYQFEVVAVDGDGIFSIMPAAFSFTIAPPFWQRWSFIVLLILASGAIVATIFMQRIKSIKKRNKQQYELVQSQLTALKAQMNPHFIHNALNSIQDLIVKHDIENSNQYLVKFSMLMRKVLDVSAKEFITIQEEIEILGLYLDLEKLRFGKEFTYTIHLDSLISADETFIPPLLLQPFVENAIKHGLLHKKGERTLTISFKKESLIICTITDNGVGRKKSAEINSRNFKNTSSFATQATEKRIDLLIRYTNAAFKFEIIDLHEGTSPSGTQVILSLAERQFMN